MVLDAHVFLADLEDLDRARARFAELRPDPLRLPRTAATHAIARSVKAFGAGDWDAVREEARRIETASAPLPRLETVARAALDRVETGCARLDPATAQGLPGDLVTYDQAFKAVRAQ